MRQTEIDLKRLIIVAELKFKVVNQVSFFKPDYIILTNTGHKKT